MFDRAGFRGKLETRKITWTRIIPYDYCDIQVSGIEREVEDLIDDFLTEFGERVKISWL